LWLSMIEGVGEASRPQRSRSSMRSRWLIFSNRQSSRKRRNHRNTVLLGGKSDGRRLLSAGAFGRFPYASRWRDRRQQRELWIWHVRRLVDRPIDRRGHGHGHGEVFVEAMMMLGQAMT